MTKTYNLFKKFIPIIVSLAVVSALFGLLTMIYYYHGDTITIDFKNVIPICTVLFFLLAVGTVIFFSVKVKSIHIAKIKKSFGFCHFAAALTAALAAALFFYDFFRFVIAPSTLPTLRILRLIPFVPFILYLILGMIPKKIRKKRIHIPISIKYIASIGAITWAVLGLLLIYTWNILPMSNYFKITHLFFYVLLLLFLAFEIRFELLTPAPRLYILFSFLLFVYTMSITGSVMLAKFFGYVQEVAITEFEIFLAFALGIYALSKMIAIPRTMKVVMDKERSQRRHHHKSSKEATNEELQSLSVNTDKNISIE